MVNSGQPTVAVPGGAWVGLLLTLAVTALAAFIGSAASIRSAEFYATLAKPPWAPAPGVFGPVWTLLYLMMAVAAWLVWRRAGLPAASGALALYLVQLALNALWTWLFFRWRSGAWALAEILLLWLVLVVTLVCFWRVRPVAGMLLLPYLAWVSFATALTAAVWRRNPGLL
jgi:tryptophan-rich sensory protein